MIQTKISKSINTGHTLFLSFHQQVCAVQFSVTPLIFHTNGTPQNQEQTETNHTLD